MKRALLTILYVIGLTIAANAQYAATDTFKSGKQSILNTPSNSEDGISLYPNPVVNSLNVVFDADAGIKTIVISDLIGKTVSVFKVSGNSASLDVEDLPSGVYFARLINAQGNTAATRKFNKQ